MTTGLVRKGHHTVLRRLLVTVEVLRRRLRVGVRGCISEVTVADAVTSDCQTTLSLDRRLDDFCSTSLISAESRAHQVR
jgi:hypothetical protein